jgi:hypothetical protein
MAPDISITFVLPFWDVANERVFPDFDFTCKVAIDTALRKTLPPQLQWSQREAILG